MKKKLAFYWASSCGGCEVAVLDINEKILEVIEKADIVFWPVAMDTKYKDVERMENRSIDFCFFNGAIRTSENEELAKLLRKKSKYMIAFGACACYGGIPGLANLFDKDEIFKEIYIKNPSTPNPKRAVPKEKVRVKEGDLELPKFYDVVKTLDQVVEVDYYIPGCPPPVKIIEEAFDKLLNGKELPPKGSVLAPMKSVCDECIFEKSKKKISGIKRIHEIDRVENKCFLEQGIICMGPATRAGCGAACIKAGMPCTGCMGLLPNSRDQGAKMISALASILGIEEEEEDERKSKELIDQIVDLVGTFYKYSLPAAIINRRVIKRRR